MDSCLLEPNLHPDPIRHSQAPILIVDDIADNCFLLQAFLEAEGYRVDTAESGYEAIAKIESNPPMLVLLDVMMPGMNGYEVVDNIRHHLQLDDLPILLVTGMDMAKQPSIEKTDVNGVIPKPVDLDKLLETVKALDAGAT
jgi:CheY-like chemotaxis protein